MKCVAHFIRKITQLRSSFIRNQILSHINYNPVVVCRYPSNKDEGGFADIPVDIPILNLADNKKIDINFRYLKKISKKDTKKVIEYLRKNNVKILHFHYGSDACIYSDIIKYSGIPSVVSFYGYDSFSFPKFLFGLGKRWLINRVFKNISCVIAMTDEMAKDLIKMGCPENKIIVHYHGVPSFLLKINRDYSPKKKYILLMLSYFDPVKGHLFALSAIKNLIQKGYCNILLKIVGDGYYKGKILDFISKNNLFDYVSIMGPVKYLSKDYFKVFEEADIFLQPSITTKKDKEGIPGSLVEAMFAGLPIISTHHGGIPYVIIDEETGILVKEWEIEELANAILKLINNEGLRKKLGEKARDFAINNLDIKKKQRELEEIYERAIDFNNLI